MDDYYALLGLDRDASKESIKIAFRRLAREVHPDFQPGSSENAKELLSRQMAQLNEAYAVLCDAERRRAYDEQFRMQTLLTTKSSVVTAERPAATTTQTTQRIRTRPDVDSSLVREFSEQMRANFLTKYKDFSWKAREMEGFDWALEASSWSAHSWVVLRAFAAVQSASVKSFLTYADVAMNRERSSLRKSHFLFLLPFQQVREWDSIALQCRRFVTPGTRKGSAGADAGILFLDVQNGKSLRFEPEVHGKLHKMIDWVAAHI